MSHHLKSSHSVSLPIPKESYVSERHRHTSRRNRKTVFSLRGDESPAVELPPLPRWMLNTPINTKFPMIPAPKGKIVLFTTDLCKTLHPAPRDLEFDPTGQGVSSTYQSLHDPHLKNHYWQGDSFDRLVRGGFVTPDGKVKCTLKEFNDFQHYLKRVRLEKIDQEHKRVLQIEREERELRRFESVKTAEQLAREKRIEDAQKRWKKMERERQKRLRQQLDAYDAKHACIITDQYLRHQIDEVRRELDEQKRLNHKLQMEKEEHEKKITYLKKRAREEKRRANMLEQRQISSREKQEKVLEEKWERKLMAKDSRFAREYLQKLRSDSKLNEGISARKRRLELSWLKQEADLARITEMRMKKAAEEEAKIALNLERKLAIIRKRFERKFKKLQAMLRSGGIPPVVQLQRTHRFADRRKDWERQQEEMKLQCEREMEIEREMRRQRRLERQKAKELVRARALATSAPPPVTCPGLLDKPSVDLPIVEISGHPSWSETMSRTGLSMEVLPPIKTAPSEEQSSEESITEELKHEVVEQKDVEEWQIHTDMAQALVTRSMETATAKKVVDASVQEALIQNTVITSLEKGLASSVVENAVSRAVSVASETLEPVASVVGITPSLVESEIRSVETSEELSHLESEEIKAIESVKTKSMDIVKSEKSIKDTPSTVAAKYLAAAAIGSACDELDAEKSRPPGYRAHPRRTPFRKTPSEMARQLADEALEDMSYDLTLEGKVVDASQRKTPSNFGRGLARDAVQDAVYEVSEEDYELRQTPSNVGRHLAKSVMLGAVDELDEITEAKLCLTFKDKDMETRLSTPKLTSSIDIDQVTPVKFEEIKKPEPMPELPKETPSVIAKDLTKVALAEALAELRDIPTQTPSVVGKELAEYAVKDAFMELQDEADNFLGIDRVSALTPSQLARGLVDTAIEDAAADIEKADGTEVETRLRQTHSNVGRQLAKGAVARAKDDLHESTKLFKARKRSFYKSRSSEIAILPEPIAKPRKIQSDLVRDLARRAIDSATRVLEDDEGPTRKTPSDIARDLAQGAISEVSKDLEVDPVMHVIYRRTSSNVARLLAEDAMEDVREDLAEVGEQVDTIRRKTPSSEARILAKKAVVDAAHEINDQVPVYRTPSPVRKTPSDMGRGVAEGVLLDAVGELEREGTLVDGPYRSTPSYIARGLAKTAVTSAATDLDRQSPTYVLPDKYRRTPSGIARAVTGDIMSEAIGELEEGGHVVDGTSRKTPSNLARQITDGVIADAETEIEHGTSTDRTYTLQGKTSSNIARQIAHGALADGIDDIEDEGKRVEGILRKTPSNLGRVLARDAIGEALVELDDKASQSHHLATTVKDSMAPAPSLLKAQDLAAVAIHGAKKELQEVELSGSSGDDDLEFDDDDLKEIWGNTSVMLASVMDVFSEPLVAVASHVEVGDEDEEDDEGDEEVIGVLENALIAENEPVLNKSDSSLTEIVHISDDGKLVVEGAVKISSSEGPSLKSSVTEAALSMESLKKSTSGQLIRETSSESSAGETETSKQLAYDDRKGPQYFRVVPLYQNKSIDVGDDIIKTNLSAISIKPDIKKGLGVAHQPHSRNSFRNIFRPDMTYCEGSAKCLKDTLVNELSKQSSTELNKETLDECCKVLDEKQPDITARHSDEELVTIGDVEGVCLWPKRRGYKAHVINEPVPEAEVEEENSGDLQTSITKDSTTDLNPDESEQTLIAPDQHSGEGTLTKKSGSLISSVVSKISDVFRKRSGETSANEVVGLSQDTEGRLSDETKDLSAYSNELSTKRQKTVDYVDEGVANDTKISDIRNVAGDGVESATTNNDGDKFEREVPEEQLTHKSIEMVGDEEHKLSALDVDEDDEAFQNNDAQDITTIECKQELGASKTKVIDSKKSRQNLEDTTKAKKTKSDRIASTTSSKKSLSSRKSSSASIPRQKSNVSIIYVKPADPKLSRSSCTVLRAGKSISRESHGSQPSQRVRTPNNVSRHRSSTHHSKPSRSTSREVHKTTSAKSDGNYLSTGKADSEEAELRQFKSLTTTRKMSQQALPTSSHRALEMATKLSHSASELEGSKSSNATRSDQSDEINSDALWPVSRPASSSRPSSSQAGSECPGARTPPEEPGSANRAYTTKPMPKASPEQLDLSPRQIARRETSLHQTDNESAQITQQEGREISYERNDDRSISADNVQHSPQVAENVPSAHRDSHHHHSGRRPSMIEAIISRVFSHSSTSSSSHHDHHHDHHSRRQSIIEIILDRVHSITHHRRSNQVLPIMDDDVGDTTIAETTESEQDH